MAQAQMSAPSEGEPTSDSQLGHMNYGDPKPNIRCSRHVPTSYTVDIGIHSPRGVARGGGEGGLAPPPPPPKLTPAGLNESCKD